MDEVQAISRLKPQCANMNFSDQIRYTRMFQKVVHKEGEIAINYIKIFHNAKALEISARSSYTEYQLMHTFLDNLQQGGNYYSNISILQAEFE